MTGQYSPANPRLQVVRVYGAGAAVGMMQVALAPLQYVSLDPSWVRTSGALLDVRSHVPGSSGDCKTGARLRQFVCGVGLWPPFSHKEKRYAGEGGGLVFSECCE